MKFTGERCILGKSGDLIEKEHLDRYKFALGYVDKKIVLDVACGSGYGTKLLSDKAKEVIGVDLSEESIKYAEENASAKNIKFIKGSATDLYFIEDNSIDIVISFETIEHIPDYEKFLMEIKRVLKEGGVTIISTPNKRHTSHKLEKPKNPYHVIEFYKNEFKALLEKYFKLQIIYGQESMSFLVKNRNRLIKLWYIIIYKKKYRTFYEKYLFKKNGIYKKNNIESCLFMLAICKK